MTTAFFEAVKRGDLAEVERMISQEPGLLNSRTQAGVSAVLLAIYYGNPAVADLLIDHGAPLDIFESAAAGRLERVKSLLAADPSLVNAYAADGFQALGLAAFLGHEEVVQFLLAQGATVNSPSNNAQRVQPLHSAVAGKHLEIAGQLLSHGAQVNACQSGGFTPLHGAAQNGQVEMLQLLLDHGADAQATSFDGKSALDFALENGQLQAADLLRAGD